MLKKEEPPARESSRSLSLFRDESGGKRNGAQHKWDILVYNGWLRPFPPPNQILRAAQLFRFQ